jgi:hypothetical protein
LLRVANDKAPIFHFTLNQNRNPLGRQIEPVDGPGVMKHRLKAEATSAAVSLSAFGGLFNYFSGNLTRKTLLFVVVPLIFLSYFGTLAFAIFRFPEAYDWRDSVISHLISPRNNPEFHSESVLRYGHHGAADDSICRYINRRLRVASQLGANIGAFAFGSGVIWLILASLIVSQFLVFPISALPATGWIRASLSHLANKVFPDEFGFMGTINPA